MRAFCRGFDNRKNDTADNATTFNETPAHLSKTQNNLKRSQGTSMLWINGVWNRSTQLSTLFRLNILY